MKTVITHVLCTNTTGEAEIYTTPVTLSEDSYAAGDHYNVAKGRAQEEGFESVYAFDEFEPAGKAIMPNDLSVMVLVTEDGVKAKSSHPMKLVYLNDYFADHEQPFDVGTEQDPCEVAGFSEMCTVDKAEVDRVINVIDNLLQQRENLIEVAPL